MAPQIPDRWLKYQPIGKRIDGTRFIAFKVPLREQVNRDVEEDNRLDGKLLLEKVPNLGIIIDLTNTNRYYDPNFFRNEGVDHKKLMIPGHVTPPPRLVNRFKDFVKRFIENNEDNDKLIGVHCTHGVNRTGYLICSYMVSEMMVDPLEAMEKFSEARGHQIERTNYIDSLQSMDCSKEKEPVKKESHQKIPQRRLKEKEEPQLITNWRTEGREREAHRREKPQKKEIPQRNEKQVKPALQNWRIPREQEPGDQSNTEKSRYEHFNRSRNRQATNDRFTWHLDKPASQSTRNSDRGLKRKYASSSEGSPTDSGAGPTAAKRRISHYNRNYTNSNNNRDGQYQDTQRNYHSSKHYEPSHTNYSRSTAYSSNSSDGYKSKPRMRTDYYNSSRKSSNRERSSSYSRKSSKRVRSSSYSRKSNNRERSSSYSRRQREHQQR